MAEVIRMPLLSDTMTEGKIISWNKKVGDTVKADDVLADVETDKATMEVNGYVDGTLLYVGVPAGEAAKVNQIIAIVVRQEKIIKRCWIQLPKINPKKLQQRRHLLKHPKKLPLQNLPKLRLKQLLQQKLNFLPVPKKFVCHC